MTRLVHNRWQVAAHEFAVRVTIPDVTGYFDSIARITGIPSARSIVIEPGTRSAVIENGTLLGEIYAGEYTLESFTERIKFWKNRQTTVYLTRSEDLIVECHVRGVPTREGICIDVTSNWSLQLNHVVLFIENLFGPREILTLDEVKSVLTPLLQQAVRDFVGQSSYDQVLSSQANDFLQDAVIGRLKIKLTRLGFMVSALQSATFIAQDGGLASRQGELWLVQRENQLQRAANEIDNEQVQSDAADMRKKVDLRVRLRELVSEDRLNKTKNREEFERGLLEIDKDRLLREEERELLIRAYEDRRTDQTSLREHFLALVDLQREQEIDALRLSVGHATQMIAIEQEIAQARLSRTAAGDKWAAELQLQREQLTHRNEQQLVQHRAKWGRLREARQNRREEELKALLHEQQAADLRAELEFSRAERQRQLAIFQAEMESRLAQEKLETQKRQEEWELDHRSKRVSAQLERLQRVQEMNAQFAEREQRLKLEMEMLREEQSCQRELTRMQAMNSVSTEVLVATANVANAQFLADLKKHEASQEAIKAQVAASPEAVLNAERLRMYEILNATERAKADAVTDAYRLAMQAQQQSVGQMIGGLAQAASPPAQLMIGHPVGVTPPLLPTTPPAIGVSMNQWYFAVNGQSSAAQTLQQISQLAERGQIDAATLIWKTGWPAWKSAAEVAELDSILGSLTSETSSGPPSLP